MSTKKPGRPEQDVLGDILTGALEDAASELDGLSEVIHRSFGVQAKPQTQPDPEPVSESHLGPPSVAPAASGSRKKKTTHYLSEETVDVLDSVRGEIRKLLVPKLQSRVSKSEIVDHALRIVLEEFGKKGKSSVLVEEILRAIRKGR